MSRNSQGRKVREVFLAEGTAEAQAERWARVEAVHPIRGKD